MLGDKSTLQADTLNDWDENKQIYLPAETVEDTKVALSGCRTMCHREEGYGDSSTNTTELINTLLLFHDNIVLRHEYKSYNDTVTFNMINF